MTIREITGIQHLNAGLVIAVKRGGRVWTTSVARLGRIREPDSEMIDLDGTSSWIASCTVKENCWRRGYARCLDESFFVEDAGEVPDASSVCVGDDVSLVPRQAEWSLRNLEEERGELGFGRQVEYLDVHVLNRTQVADSYPARGIGRETRRGAG